MNRKTLLGFALGPLGAAALGFISLPMSTWLFAPEDIGRISMLQTITALCTILFSLGLDQSYLREYHQTQARGTLLRKAALPGFVALLIAMVVVFCFDKRLIAHLMYGVDSAGVGVTTAVVIAAGYSSRFSSLPLRMSERGLAFSMSQLAPKLLFVTFVGTLALYSGPRDFNSLLAAHSLSVILAALIFGFNARTAWQAQDPEGADAAAPKLIAMARYGMPMMLAGLAYWTLEAMDKVMLRSLSSFAELGSYSVAMGIASIAATLSTLFTTIWVPTAFKWATMPDGSARFAKLRSRVVAVAALMISLGGLLSFALDYLLPSAYHGIRYLIVTCMLPSLLFAVSEVTGIGSAIAHKSTHVLAASIVTGILNLGLNYLLIPPLGAKGAAIATAIAFFAMLVLRTEASRLSWQIVPRLPVYGPLAALSLLALLQTSIGAKHPIEIQLAWIAMTIVLLARHGNMLLETARQIIRRDAAA